MTMIFVDVIETEWGLIRLGWREGAVVTLEMPTGDDIARASLPLNRRPLSESGVEEMISLPSRLQQYFSGVPVDFSNVPVEEHGGPFHRRVREVLRTVVYGASVSYAELAAMAGSPRAARAAGQAMACNRIPIVIPCHRVLGAGGRTGGFSSGANVKAELLRLEGIAYR